MEGAKIRVLFVDDDESFATVISSSLSEEFGFQVAVCHSGKEALELLRKEKQGFDVMVLDYMMPEMSGLEVLQRLYEDRNETPTLMLTAEGSERIAVEVMKLGAYDYCRKEYTDLQHLANMIRASHERHQFRVAKVFEEEQAREMVLNKEATEKVRDVINAITPMLNAALANIAAELETRSGQILSSLPVEQRDELQQMSREIQTQVGTLEAGIRGLLSLYQLMYVRYPEVKDLDHIRKEFEERTKQIVPKNS